MKENGKNQASPDPPKNLGTRKMSPYQQQNKGGISPKQNESTGVKKSNDTKTSSKLLSVNVKPTRSNSIVRNKTANNNKEKPLSSTRSQHSRSKSREAKLGKVQAPSEGLSTVEMKDKNITNSSDSNDGGNKLNEETSSGSPKIPTTRRSRKDRAGSLEQKEGTISEKPIIRKRSSTSRKSSKRSNKNVAKADGVAVHKKLLHNHGSDLLIQMEQMLLEEKELQIENFNTQVKPTHVPGERIGTASQQSESMSVTEDTFQQTSWDSSFKSLLVNNCSYVLLPNKQLKASKDTLRTLAFSNLTKLKNISVSLKTCENITALKLCNVVLFQQPRLDQSPPVELPHLDSLTITQWFYSLTRNEYWLLDFIMKSFSIPNVTSIIFHGTDALLPQKIQQDSQAHLTHRQASISSLLEKCPKANNLSFGGLGFKVDSPLHLSGIQPSVLRLDLNVPGVEEILKNVKQIKILVITGSVAPEHRSKFNTVTECAAANSKTLKTLKILPWFTAHEHPISLYNLNLEPLKECDSLECLHVNVTMTRSSRMRIPCGKIYNLHCLPPALTCLELYSEEVRSEEIFLVGMALPELRNLKLLVLSGNTSKLFEIPTSFMKSICEQLSSFKEGYFFGGTLEDSFGANLFFQSQHKFNFRHSSDYVSMILNPKSESVSKICNISLLYHSSQF